MAKILILDDEHLLLELAQEQLENTPHEITATTEGKKALQLIRKGELDLVVTDYKLDGQNMDGIDIAREAFHKKILVIIYSGSEVPLPEELQTVLVIRKPSLALRKIVLDLLNKKDLR